MGIGGNSGNWGVLGGNYGNEFGVDYGNLGVITVMMNLGIMGIESNYGNGGNYGNEFGGVVGIGNYGNWVVLGVITVMNLVVYCGN